MKTEVEVSPIIGIGTKFDVSGHTANVTAIEKDGVYCRLDNGREFSITFEQAELAWDQTVQRLQEEAERAKRVVPKAIEESEKPAAKKRATKKTADKRPRKKTTRKKAKNDDSGKDPGVVE